MEAVKANHDSIEWLKEKKGLEEKEIEGLIELSNKLEITLEALIRKIII